MLTPRSVDPGFLFMFGIYGKRPSRQTVKLLRDTGASGVLLLARNIDSTEQVRALTRGLEDALGRRLLFAIDHEGGWVLRFSAGVTAFPGNAALGRAGDPALAYATGRQMALELAPLGIGMNLASVVDVTVGRYNPGIGIRSFGDDPALVSRLGVAFMRGLQDHGVAACAKHFPGKGAATVDAHVGLPTIRLPQREFLRTHLAPFAAAARAGVASIMTTHVRCPALDRSRPATFSRRIVHGLIRGRLRYGGVVISDDLCMGAVTTRGPVTQAALDSFLAGHDIVMIAHDVSAQLEAVELFRTLQAQGELPAGEVARSCRRIEDIMRLPARGRPAPDRAAGLRLARQVADRAVEVTRTGRVALPLSPDGPATLVLYPDFREVRERFTFEGGPLGPERLLRRGAAAGRGRLRLRRTPVQSTDLEDLPRLVAGAGRVVFFCFEAMRFPGQKAVLELLRRAAAERTVACLIRSSWDQGLLDRRTTVVDPRGYRLCQLAAAWETVFGQRIK